MPTRQELIDLAQQKFQREQLISQAQEKWKAENLKQVQPEPIGAEKIETAARSALEGATFGVSEPVISGVNSVIGNLIDSGFEAEGLKDFFSKSIDSVRLKKEFEQDVARRRGLEAQLPGVSLASEIGGALVTPMGLGKGVATVGKAAVAGVERALAPVLEVAPVTKLLPEALAQAGRRIAEASATGVAGDALKQAVEVPTGFMKPEERLDLGQVGTSAAALTGALEAIPLVGKAIKAQGKKLLSALGGVSEEGINNYLKDPQALVRAKSPSQIKDTLDNFVSELIDEVEKGKLSVSQGQILLNEAKASLDAEVKSRLQEFRSQKFDATLAKKEAQQSFNEAAKLAKKDLSSALSADKLALRDDVVLAIDNLKQKVKQDSVESYKILQESGRVISVKPAIEAAKSALNDLKIQGKRPEAGASAKAYDQIESYFTDLKRYKNILTTSDAKKKIQQLDQDYIASLTAGEFTDLTQRALRSIRSAFDNQLKDIPEYAKIMSQLSSNTELLSQSNKAFGNLEKASSRLAKIESIDRDLDRQLLTNLGNATNRPFEQRLIDIQQKSQGLTPESIQSALVKTPEASELRKANLLYEKMSRPELPEKIRQSILTGEKAIDVQQASQNLLNQQQMLQTAQEKLKSIGPFGRPASNISAIKTAVSQKNPEYDKYLKTLSNLSEQDFNQYINDLRITEQFQKEFRIGSRNVNLWSLGAGAGVYALTGDPTSSLIIAGLGGNFGALIDKFGPRMTQKILDKYIQVKGIPTLQKIDQIFKDLPTEVKNYAKQDLVRAYTIMQAEPLIIDDSNKFDIIQDIKNSNLPSTIKAKNIKNINNNKAIDSLVLSNIGIGQKPKMGVAVPVPSQENSVLKEDRPEMLKALDRIKK